MSTIRLPRRLRLLVPGTLLALCACKSDQPEPPAPPSELPRAEISSELTATAEVVALVPADRQLTLRREDGMVFEIRAASGVRNFEQIAVGDVLRVRYKEILTAAKLPPGQSATPVQGALATARMPAGAKPGAGIGVSIHLKVKIESVDLERDVVVYSLAGGELIARRLQTPEGRKFATEIAVGDVVQIEYTEALALSVEEL